MHMVNLFLFISLKVTLYIYIICHCGLAGNTLTSWNTEDVGLIPRTGRSIRAQMATLNGSPRVTAAYPQ